MLPFVTNKTYQLAVDTMNTIKTELDSTKVELLTYLQKNNHMFDFTMDIIKKYIPVEEQECYINKVNTVWTKPEVKTQSIVEELRDEGLVLCTFNFTVGTVFDNTIPSTIKGLAQDYEFKNVKLTRTKENPTSDDYMLTCKCKYLEFEKFKKDAKKIF